VSLPSGLAFDQAGNLYVANTGSNTIEKFDTNGYGTPFVTTGLNFPQALAFDSSGNLYVANAGNHEIDKYDTNGNGSPFVSFGGGTVAGLAFDSAGNLYASFVGGANMIYKFDTSGAPSFVASGFDGPTFIAIQIPEPATWILVALGAATLLGRRRLYPRPS
jgi:DNA-binding beta-propeller fold protein YncE